MVVQSKNDFFLKKFHLYSTTSTTPSSSYILRSSVSDMPLTIPNANLTDEEDNLFKEGTVSASKGVFRQKRIPTEPSDLSVLGEYCYLIA